MHINLEKNSQILDFDKLKWFLPCLVLALLLPDWKDNKGKETPLWARRSTYLWVDRFFGSKLKILANEATYFDVLSMQYIYIETSGSTLEKKCCLIRNLTYSLEWNAMKKVCKLVWLEHLEISPAGRQTPSRSGCVCVCGGGAGGAGVEREYSISHDHTIRAIHGFLIIHQ